MIQSFRNFFQSKWGVAFTLGFLGLIAFAFASGDVASTGGFGSASAGDKVAKIGKKNLTSNEVERSISTILTRMRQTDPTATMASFLSRNGLEDLLTYLIDRRAGVQFGERHGLHIGDRLIDSEIAKIPRIQGPDGKVDPNLYRQYLAERGMSDAEFRTEVAEELMSRQLAGSNSLGIRVPQKVAMRYAAVVTERRKGFIVTLPSAAFAPATPPNDAEISDWYNGNKAAYALPERRTIRYIVFGDSVIKDVPAPTEAEIAARYNLSKDKYAPTDKRKLTQIVLPTEAAAKVVFDEVTAGKSLEASAAAKGLSVAALGSLTKQEYGVQSSVAAADAVFAAPVGTVAGPFKVPLGFVVVRIDAKDGTPGKTLDQARPELLKELGEEKRREAIAEFSGRIDENIANGASLSDVAKDMGLEVIETPQLLANGGVYGQDGVTAPEVLAPVLQAAFAMESEKQPQLAEVDPGKTFMVFDVGSIAPAAPPPLAQIRAQVITDIQQSKGAKAAKAAAEKVQDQVQKGVPIEKAIASLGVSLPPIDRVDKSRMEVQAQGQNASKPEMLVFTMAKGKVRLLAAPRNRGWYVVSVTEVTPGVVKQNDPRLPGLQETLAGNIGAEYADQLGGGMRNEVGVTRNQGTVDALKKRLQGVQ